MAIFDPHEQRLCVRVVYDGVAGAGKTTNLRQLATLFASQRATEVHSPSELDGRTLYFDWMEINAGLVAGIPLLCQVISVPGQIVLTPRRRHLLATADVIIYVSDSAASSIDRSRAALDVVTAVAQERGLDIPLVVQANKQDQTDALESARVAELLGRTGDPVVEAIAAEGIGVVDTFVAAIRSLSRSIQGRANAGDFRLEVRRAESEDRALSRVSAEAIDPEWAAEMLLEEASAAYLVAAVEAKADGDANSVAASSGATERRAPTLPHAGVPTGFIWPAHTGRTTLHSLAVTGALRAVPTMQEDGTVTHEACGFVLRTHVSRRYEQADAARQALVRAARERTQLEQLLMSETVVVAQSDDDGAWWIWTVMPEVPTLLRALDSVREDEAGAHALLDAYGAALVDAVRTSVRHGFGLEMAPSAFGVEGGALRYVGDVLPARGVDDLADAIASAIADLERARLDVGVVLAAFERDIHRRLTHEERAHTANASERVQALLARAVEVR